MKIKLIAFTVKVLFCFSAGAESFGTDSKNLDKERQKALLPAQQSLKSGQAEESERQLSAVLRSDSANVFARQFHAEVLYQLGRFHYAADELKEVLNLDPKNAEAFLLMGKIQQSIHRPAQAIENYNKYIALAPADSSSQQYALLARVLGDEVHEQVEKKAKNRVKVGDYLAAVTGGALMRWKEPSAIRVYVKNGAETEGYRPEFEESLRQAFDDWNNSTEGKIGFVFLPDSANAMMTVTWTSDLHSPALKAEAGLAKTSYGADGLDKAEILLLTVDPFKEGPIARNYLYNICLHEIGHALGLQGHSPYPEDIMSPSLSVQQGLSDRDVNTILKLYSADSTNADELPDKDEWGRPLAPKVKCERLINAGTAAAMAGQYEKAIEKLEAALLINPNAEIAKKNLAVAANNSAIADQTQSDKSINLLHLALYWDPQNNAARGNLNSRLQASGKDPRSFSLRLSLGDQCFAKGDLKGAFVEYREALSIKDDAATRNKLNKMKSPLDR